jgi:hypothetical protein
MFRQVRFAHFYLTAVLFLSFALPSSAQVMTVRQEVHHDVSAPLAELAAMTPKEPASDIKREAEPVRTVPIPVGPIPVPDHDPTLQTSAERPPVESAPSFGFSFEGQGTGFPGYSVNVAPPDTNGAVGLTQYVQWVNTSFVVFNKSTGGVIAGPFQGNVFWAGFGGGCQNNNDGDPIVAYDKIANRWIFSQFSVSSGPFLQCVAVSTSSDATGTYNRYSFQYSNFDDYPKMGVWPDAYYETFNLFSGNNFVGAQACAYDRIAMLNGAAATQQCFQIPGDFGFLPSDFDGTILPPAGSPNYVMAWFDTNNLEMYKFHVDFATPANTTFVGRTIIPVAPFAPLCPSGTCVTQPAVAGFPNSQLDSLSGDLMFRLAYRNFGGHESLALSHSVAAGNSGGVRWYEIQSPGTTPTVVQQGTFAPDNDFRWMGSIAMDKVGNMAMGYSVSGNTTFPSIAITGRTPFNTPGTMQTETVIMSGTGSQLGLRQNGQPLTRWGDYSAMQVDPSDDCTFWYTQEYMQNTGIFNWNTRIANVKFGSCITTPPAALNFVPATPCRIADTRLANGPFGGPFLSGQTTRGFTIPSSACSIPPTAQAYSLNVTVVPHGPLGFLTTFPCGQPQPLASTLNSDGRIKAVAAIVPAGTSGAVCFFVTNDTDLVLDIDGYFVPATTPSTLSFFPVTPCRLVDTRLANGPLGGPFLVGNATGRTFPIQSAPCNLPGTAQAYSLNYTAVPRQILGFLTTWPAGQTKPLVSTLNAPTAAITANAAIVPAGTGGAVQVFVSNDSDLIIDVNGYFAPFVAGGLSLYNLAPCRLLDTRIPTGSQPVQGTTNLNVVATGCGAPQVAQAYVLNGTVVPPGPLSFLTLWPQGATQPTVSTLNAGDGAITSNMAIVPTTNNSISAFTSNPSHVILDISGYFAP